MDSSTLYEAPEYLVTSTGLTVVQLRFLFEGFKRTLHFVPSAPELVFERILANAFALSTPTALAEVGDEFKQVLEDLREEISALNDSRMHAVDNVGFGGPHTSDHSQSLQFVPQATPIKFVFAPSPYGLSTQAIQYNSYDGVYGAGCSWSDLKLADNQVQFGSFNSIEMEKSGPQSFQWGTKIEFAKRFREDPEVVVWLTGVDMRCKRPCYIQVSATEIRETGFEVFVSSSEDDVWFSLGISWVAWPSEKSRYSYGSFETVVYGKPQQVEFLNFKLFDLPKGSGVPDKTILAVRKLAMGCGGTMPFLLKQMYPARDESIFCCVETDQDGTGMYVLDVVCIACASVE